MAELFAKLLHIVLWVIGLIIFVKAMVALVFFIGTAAVFGWMTLSGMASGGMAVVTGVLFLLSLFGIGLVSWGLSVFFE